MTVVLRSVLAVTGELNTTANNAEGWTLMAIG